MSNVYFYFKNLSDEQIELFDEVIRNEVIDDLQIDCNSTQSGAMLPEENLNAFVEFLDKNHIKTESMEREKPNVEDTEIQEIDLRNGNGWNLK